MAHSEGSNRHLTDDELTDLWKESFRVSLPVESGKKMRLKELETWDIPNGSPSNNPYPWRTCL